MREPVPVVRSAEDRDLPDVARIVGSIDEGGSAVRGSDDHAAFIKRTPGRWLVAEVGGSIVGAARVSLDSLPRPAVYCVAVHERARGLGVGAALLDEFRRRVRETGGTAVDAFALPGDRETKNLYERAGLTARLIVATGPA